MTSVFSRENVGVILMSRAVCVCVSVLRLLFSTINSTQDLSLPTRLATTMAGDHKCPVCQATFTRPQHVARHMRSRKHYLSYPLHLAPQFKPFSFAPSLLSLQIPVIVHTSVSIVEISSLEGFSFFFPSFPAFLSPHSPLCR
jgi:uncharacterized Zn-finger protein